MLTPFTKKLLDWYHTHARKLPWRQFSDPYLIWISEVMLQQTQVETVIPYILRWQNQFPTLEDVARASLHDILIVWEGLGYYQRASNIHKAAQIIMNEFHGEFPQDVNKLRKIPGIGKYTAGAISSMAFNMDEPAPDVNAKRVLARFYCFDHPIRSPYSERRLWQFAKDNLPHGYAKDYNQALMDLGATICSPRQTSCHDCPLQDQCQAKKNNRQDAIPISAKRSSIPKRIAVAAIVKQNGSVLISQRPNNGLLGNLWEYPGSEPLAGESLEDCLKRKTRELFNMDIEIGNVFGIYRHAYSHFSVTLHAYSCELENNDHEKVSDITNCLWVNINRLQEFPMGKIDRKISSQLIASLSGQE